MKAVLLEEKGIDNIKIKDVPEPSPGPHEIKIRIIMAGLHFQDYTMARELNANGSPISPIPHIPGEELVGRVSGIGSHVNGFAINDRVIVYHRIFDGTCDMCLRGHENLCYNRGRFGVDQNGAFAEYMVVPEKNVIRVPESIPDELATSIPISFITPYHALLKASLSEEDTVAVFGATGNTGMFALQIAKRTGAKTIAISRKESSWLKDFGADLITTPENALDSISDFTGGEMCSIVVDPVGSKTWNTSISLTAFQGRYVTYGSITGGSVSFSLTPFYKDEKSIIGSRGGTRVDLYNAIKIIQNYKVKTWEIFDLEQADNALKNFNSPDRQGRIFIKMPKE